MVALLLALLNFVLPLDVSEPAARALQPDQATSLRLDLRVFDGLDEVTDATVITVYDAGSRTTPRVVPAGPEGERRIALPAGQYDLQLLHQDDGRVLAVRWTSLRLLVAYPGEHGRHLEVLNLRPGHGALQVRRAGATPETGVVGWSATLRHGGRDTAAATAVPGDGYLLFVAPPGRYDLDVRTPDGRHERIRDVEIRENLTYLTSW